jgi:outer membrane protein assembly factor BamB
VIAPGREFNKLAENELEAGCMASPAVAGNALFVRTKTHLYRIEK